VLRSRVDSWLERLARDQYSCLFRIFVNYGSKKDYNIDTRNGIVPGPKSCSPRSMIRTKKTEGPSHPSVKKLRLATKKTFSFPSLICGSSKRVLFNLFLFSIKFRKLKFFIEMKWTCFKVCGLYYKSFTIIIWYKPNLALARIINYDCKLRY
jgi:hypothetical protein